MVHLVFFGPYFHSHTHTVSFLVLEALGEDGMPVFPGPGNELSRITSPN